METQNDASFVQGPSDNETRHTTAGQRPNLPLPTDSPHHASYFDTGLQNDSPPSHSIPPIPEGSTVRLTAISEKSPSPLHSSAPTTGTTTSPTSIGNLSTSGERDFPRDAALPAQPQQTSVTPRDETWHGHGVPTQRYAGGGGGPNGGGGVGSPPSSSDQDPARAAASATATAAGPQPRYNPAQYPAALKLLVSNNVAGSIIGRAGQTISELQAQSSTRIKLSQTGDYYPGTQDRVCLVQGETVTVKTALRLLLDRLYMLQEQQHSHYMAWQLQRQKGAPAQAFDFVVRILVPTSSCGMIIGKSGSNIKSMEETTGVSSVRLSPKELAEIPPTAERIMTITGSSAESCLQCLYIIVDAMSSHPDSCRYINMTTSYSRVITDGFPSRSAVLVPVPPTGVRSPDQQHHLWENAQPFQATGQPVTPAAPPGLPPRKNVSSPDLHAIALGQRRPGLSGEPSTPERLPGYNSGVQPIGPFASHVPNAGSNMYSFPSTGHSEAAGTGLHHASSEPDLLSLQLESVHLTPQPQPPAPQPPQPHSTTQQQQPLTPTQPDFTNAFVQQSPHMISPGSFAAQVLVPDSMIGSIFGRGGRTLADLKIMSGTHIRISQRGEYMPGTRSRIVTIRGPTAHSVWQAQCMMGERMVLPPTAGYLPRIPPPPAALAGDPLAFHGPPPPHQQAQQQQEQPPQQQPPAPPQQTSFLHSTIPPLHEHALHPNHSPSHHIHHHHHHQQQHISPPPQPMPSHHQQPHLHSILPPGAVMEHSNSSITTSSSSNNNNPYMNRGENTNTANHHHHPTTTTPTTVDNSKSGGTNHASSVVEGNTSSSGNSHTNVSTKNSAGGNNTDNGASDQTQKDSD